MRNLKLLLCYDGTRYRGWQRLGDSDNTIQGKLEAVLTRMVGHPVEVIGSGRTDAGAHALGQTANFHCQTAMNCREIRTYLRQYLPEDIGVISVEEVPERFHSRYCAIEKTYRYRVWNSELPCVFERRFVYEVEKPLDVAAMQEAAQVFLGAHDFSAFCSNKRFKKSAVRSISRFVVERQGPEVVFTATGDGFLYNMVRILVGTLLDVGIGVRSTQSLPEVLEGRIRENAGPTVPARGLCLMEVRY